MNIIDNRTGNTLWLFVVLCAIAAFVLITSFRDAPEKPPAVEQSK